MRDAWKKWAAGAMTAVMMFASCPAAWAEDTAADGVIPAVTADLEDGDGFSPSELFQEGAYHGSMKLELGQAVLDALAEDEGEDLSWMKSIGGSWAFCADDGEVRFSGESLLNDGHVMDILGKYAGETQTLYLNMPELSDQSVALDLRDLFSSSAGGSSMSPDDIIGSFSDGLNAGLGITAEDQARLQQEAEDLAASISPEEVSSFLDRYAGTVMANMSTEQAKDVEVSAGSLSEKVNDTTIRIDSDQMDKILQTSASSLKDDEFVLKLIQSDLIVDLVNIIGKATASGESSVVFDTNADLSAQTTADETQSAEWKDLSADEITAYYQSAMDSFSTVSGIPGFSLTLGNGSDGKLKSLGFSLLYSGMEIPVFDMTMLKQGDQNAFGFKLGEMLAQALISSDGDDSASGDGTGTTGLFAEGTDTGGILNETVTVLISDQTLCEVDLIDWNTAGMKDGILEGSLSVNTPAGAILLQCESPDKETEKFTVSLNDEMLGVLTLSLGKADESEVKDFDETGALPIQTQDDFYNDYLASASTDALVQNLIDAGMPQSLLEEETEAAA